MVTPLARLLLDELARRGPVTFAEFMARALQDPDHGYYGRGKRPGREGDFVTAPEASAVLGHAIGRRLRGLAGRRWELAELGPGTGRLCRDILDALGPGAAPVRVHAVDVAADAAEVLAGALGPAAAGLRVFRSVEGLPAFDGVVVANEFVDALPVNVLEKDDDGRWHELLVAARHGELVTVTGDPTPVALEWARRFAPEVDPGARFTAMAGLGPLLTTLGERLRQGVVLIVDYGGPAAERWGGNVDGTLRAFRRGTAVDPLGWPGECDITSDVNTSALGVLARAAGFAVTAELSQGAFLAHLGALEAGTTGDSGLRFVGHPGMMGERFRVVVLDKGGWAARLGLRVEGGDTEVWERLSRTRR